jgi:hypothetical protein
MVRADLCWRRGLEQAADNREATPVYGVRLQSTSHVSLESPLGARREAMHARGGSPPEERHGLAAEVVMIYRRRENSVQRVFE